MSETAPPLARALGRIPSGLFIVTTLDGQSPVGFLGSFVMQVGFAPPTVCVAVGKERGPLAAMRQHGHFALSILDADSRGLMGPFFKPPAEGTTPFDGMDLRESASGCPVLAGSLAWMGMKVAGEYDAGDHVVIFGEVTEGDLFREGDPQVHLRKNGLSY